MTNDVKSLEDVLRCFEKWGMATKWLFGYSSNKKKMNSNGLADFPQAQAFRTATVLLIKTS